MLDERGIASSQPGAHPFPLFLLLLPEMQQITGRRPCLTQQVVLLLSTLHSFFSCQVSRLVLCRELRPKCLTNHAPPDPNGGAIASRARRSANSVESGKSSVTHPQHARRGFKNGDHFRVLRKAQSGRPMPPAAAAAAGHTSKQSKQALFRISQPPH